MRYITIPKSVEIENTTVSTTGKPAEVSFRQFVRNILVGHGDVTKNDENLRLFMEIGDKVKEAEVGSVVELSGEQHELLSTLARTFQYAPDFKLSILPLIRAVTSAPDKAG
jgi:hypothetical protein